MIVVDVAVIHDSKILLVDYKGIVFILPGGTLEPGEEDLACLGREALEEIGLELPLEKLSFFDEFVGLTHDGNPLRVRLYIFLSGAFQPTPTEAKIESVMWTSYTEALTLNLSGVTRQIVIALRAKGYL